MSETDRRGGAYAPPPDDYETFDARDAEQDRRGWLFLGAAAVVFILFVAVVWNTFQLGVREREDSPVIAADAEPYRVPPADPGGYEAPDQDLAVTQLREGGAEDASADQPAAQPRETTEEPVDPPAREMPDVTIETTDADALDDPLAEQPARDEPASDPEPVRQDPDPAPAQSQPAPSQPAPSLPAASSSGPFVAQIAAYRSEGDAESGWLSFASRFPELASGRAPDIQRADLGDRGVFHRLRIAGFETREDAAAFCAALDARGQACLVARR
jgi:hypothetical protein